MNLPTESKNWKRFEKNNKTVALNVLFFSNNSHGLEKIRQAYISKHNSECKHQVTSVMITNGEKWHNLAAKNLSRLLCRITSNHGDDYCCMNCLYSAQRTNLNRMRRVCSTEKMKPIYFFRLSKV